jgi:DNA-binding NarL/FixJ family response regulator
MTTAVTCTSVFLLAENRLLREALSRILAKKSDLEVVGAATYSPEIFNAISTLSPDVVLLDPQDIGSSLAFLRTLREMLPAVKVIMIGMELNSELFILAVREGVMGYMLMDATATEIVAAVRCVVNGGAVCPPELCQALFKHVAKQQTSLPNFAAKHQLGLTRREQQLVGMVSRGCTNKEIALELSLSEQTVKNHIHRILRKMGVSDRLQAVEICRTHGFLIA